jgi:uncharacterized RmlC-like cupin family protein
MSLIQPSAGPDPGRRRGRRPRAALGWGGKIEEIRPGDVVRTPPGVKHWHGASPTVAMTRMAIQEAEAGKAVEWMEKVSDAQYGKQ